MKIAEYAAKRGVSTRAVQKALNDRISGARAGRGTLYPGLADRLWRRNTDPDHGGKRTAGEEVRDLDELRERARNLGIDPNSVPDIADSKALRLACLAALSQIELDEKQGRLVDQEDVRKEAFKLARLTRDAMLAIPDRLAAEIAGLTDPFEVHAKITAEIRSAIEEISKAAG